MIKVKMEKIKIFFDRVKHKINKCNGANTKIAKLKG